MGTRRQFISVVEDCARNCNAHYVTQRWLGGMLTNWSTIKTCIDNLQSFCVFIISLFIYLIVFIRFYFYCFINLNFCKHL